MPTKVSDEEKPGLARFARPQLDLEPTLTAAEVADRVGIPIGQARRLWRTLGLPERGDEKAYTDEDGEQPPT